jgi:hypothetical protein
MDRYWTDNKHHLMDRYWTDNKHSYNNHANGQILNRQ